MHWVPADNVLQLELAVVFWVELCLLLDVLFFYEGDTIISGYIGIRTEVADILYVKISEFFMEI